MPIKPERLSKFINEVEQRSSEIYGDDGGIKYFSVKQEGAYRVRVLDMGDFITGAHWGILEGQNGRAGSSIRCPKIYDEKLECPVCEMVEILAQDKDPKQQRLAEDIKAQVRFPMLVVDMSKKTDPDTVLDQLVYEAPKTVYNPIARYVTLPEKREMYGDILSQEDGSTIEIRKVKQKTKVEYQVEILPIRGPILINPEELLDLREVLKPRSYADIEYAIKNLQYPTQEQQTQQNKFQSVKRPVKAAPPPVVEDPVEEEEDDIDDSHYTPPPRPTQTESRNAVKERLNKQVQKMRERGNNANAN